MAAAQQNDRSDEYAVVQGDECIPIEPFGQGHQSAAELYDYRTPNTSPSAPTYSSYGTGDLQEDDTSILFLYEGRDGLSLVLVHDRLDGNTSGGSATMHVEGLPEDGEWVVEDDSYDGTEDTFDRRGSTSRLSWAWSEGRTDGAAFTGGLDDAFEIEIDPAFNDEAELQVYDGEITDWQVLSGPDHDSEATSLDLDRPITIHAGGCGSLTVMELDTSGTVSPGESTTIEATVTNEGVQETTSTVPVTVDGEPIDQIDVSLAPGESTTVETAVEFDETGTHTVGIADAETDVTVEGGEPAAGFGTVAVVVAGLLVAVIALSRR
ncbi:CARDB domain-containing protein [Halosolutus amylolyticus]|uniref:CARDB domain-containing protein n=1 Tax=Halosolutus amylolyticus TaxID=2932267 RepID=A0ABD5PQ16_9EURY|nr:CARDB domain-containing protein [Halosolutus amylolyticus]